MWPCDLVFEFVSSKKAQSMFICLAVAVHAQKLNSSTADGFLSWRTTFCIAAVWIFEKLQPGGEASLTT